MPPKGWKDINLKEHDFEIIEAHARENGMKNGLAVKMAFKIAYGLEFPDDALRA